MIGNEEMINKLTRNGRDYWNSSEKVICLYFTITRFRNRDKEILMRTSLRRFLGSKRIELVLESGEYYWMDSQKKLTLHNGLQKILKNSGQNLLFILEFLNK